MARLARRLALAGAAVLTAAPIFWSVAASAETETVQEREQPHAEATSDSGAYKHEHGHEDEEIEVLRVRGLRTGRFIDSPSAFSSHIDPADYAGEGKSVDDLLSEQVGLQIRRFGGAGEPATLSIRGSSAQQVELTLNGIRVNSPLSGGADVSELCLGLVDGIDIERGGRSAIGGRIDLSSPIATGERVIRASGSASSFGTWRGSAFYSDRLGQRDEAPSAGGLDIALGYCGFKTDGNYTFARPILDNGDQVVPYDPPFVQRINNDQQKHSGQVGLGTDIGERHQISLRNYTSWQKGGAPGLDSGDGPLAGQDPDARLENLLNVAQFEWSAHQMGFAGDELSVSLYHRYQNDDYDNPADPGSVIPDEMIDTRMHSAGLMTRQAWGLDGFGGSHRIGIDFDAYRDAVYSNDRNNRGRTSVEGDLAIESGFFDQRFVVSSGFRAAWSHGFDPAFLPSLGVLVTPLEWLRIKANGFGSWRVPSFEELYHPDRGFIRGNDALQPERAWGADGGIDLVFDRLGPLSDLMLSAGVFYQKLRHEIVWTQVSPWVVQPVNLEATRVLGFEAALVAEWSKWAGLIVNYTELDAELEATGRGVPGRAHREAFARMRIGPSDRWKIVGEWQYTGEIPVSQGGNVILPARHVGNLSAALNLAAFHRLGLDRFTREFWLNFAVENLGDVAVRDALFAPQPGRTLTVGIEVTW